MNQDSNLPAPASPTPLGATVEADGVRFCVWAPSADRVEIVCDDHPYAMQPTGLSYFERMVVNAAAGARYGFRINDGPLFPDPASRFQPQGVHQLPQVIDPNGYAWGDADWRGLNLKGSSIYELHVGTFSPAGNYDGARERLAHLRDLGVRAIELMPLHDFPGQRSWGYDPAAFYAPARAYGHPDQLRALVDEAHRLGLAVILDVVYNHLGPDGAYVAAYAPMFTPEHSTLWGQAINLDGQDSHGVRRFLIENALYWLREFHFDGLRLDATHTLIDDSATHLLAELAERAHALPGPRRVLIAEDHPYRMDPLIAPPKDGGHGLDGVWADDFHHVVRRNITGDSHGYFHGFPDTTQALAETITKGWYPRAQHTDRAAQGIGSPAWARPEMFVFCIQNHDQIGNRAHGDRLHHAVGLDLYRALSALLLFCPQTPLLFMGQEWAASAPFQFFCDHNPELAQQVRDGRRREFAAFPTFKGEIPNPQDATTFARSTLDWDECAKSPHAGILALYRDLLAYRDQLTGPITADSPTPGGLLVRRGGDPHCYLAVALTPGLTLPVPDPARTWQITWHSESAAYSGDPKPPRIDKGALVFDRPSAARLLEQPS